MEQPIHSLGFDFLEPGRTPTTGVHVELDFVSHHLLQSGSFLGIGVFV